MIDDSHKRAHRVAHSLQHALSSLLIEGLRDPRIGLVTVTEVRMSDDLRNARVYVSAFGDDASRQRSLLGLKAAASYLRRRVSEALNLRFAPMLHFQADDTLLKAARLDSLLHGPRPGEADVGAETKQGVPTAEAPAAGEQGEAMPKVFVERDQKTTLAGPLAPPSPAPSAKRPRARTRPLKSRRTTSNRKRSR